MADPATAHPPIVSHEEWLAQRKQLLLEEKALTKQYDALNAKRRRLPMVKVDKPYAFDQGGDAKTLLDLFEGRTQLLTYHFMFDPTWEKGCSGCTSYIDAIGDLSMLPERDTTFVVVSRAPYTKLAAYQKERGWDIDWYSSGQSDFNYDFGVTLDPARGPLTFNYKSGAELEASLGKIDKVIEMPGTSVFFRIGDDVYHTYSSYARGGESLTDSYRLLDITPYGRQEDFEDSPPGWPQRPTYG